jgi:hypothetical protein
MSAGLFVFYFTLPIAQDAVLGAIQVFGKLLADEPLALAIFLGAFALGLVILMIWMSKRYTFAHTYRIIFICLAALALVGKPIYRKLMTFKPIADSMSFLDEDAAIQILDLTAVNMLRVLAAEIVVYALFKAYGPANKSFAARKTLPRAGKPGRARSPMDVMVDSLYAFSITLANGFTRFYLQIGYTFANLALTLRNLAIHLGNFLWMLTRDLFLPILSLALSATAIHFLSISTGQYIALHQPMDLLRAFAAAAILFVGQLIFLSSKSRLNPLRFLTSDLYLLVWFSPYLLTLFIFMSLSLYAVGLVLLRWDEKLEYAYRIGPVTIGAFILTAIALVFAVLKRHREGEPINEASESQEGEMD